MGYLQRLGLDQASYNKSPYIAVHGYENECWRGWDSIAQQLKVAIDLRLASKTILAIECYSGIIDREVLPVLETRLNPTYLIQTEQDVFKSSEAIDRLLEPELGGTDPIFGRLTRLTLQDYIDPEKQQKLRQQIDAIEKGLIIVYGPAALLCAQPDIVVYADMARWEAQMRQRANKISNLGVENKTLKASLQYKRSFFIDWRVCDKLKRETIDSWDYLLDTCIEKDPKLITAKAFHAGLQQAIQQPFRVVPFFDPGIWGGQWMREVCQLPDGPPNYAWCFDCVPEENSLLLRFGDIQIEIPSINLVFFHPEALLGEPVYGRYGAEFPIRFDFLDTMQGQNLSFQVHPMIDYAREHFGLSYTQDESYYILDAEDNAEVYLGLNDDINPQAMLSDLKAANEESNYIFPDEKHVARFPAKKHDHFLIPAGTCHCSGSNSMVLEISHTPYIFTFKMWDWARLDLNGQPRPINLERGAANIQWNRTRSWVKPRLVNAITPVQEGDGWREERTGLYQSEAFETRRHWFTKRVNHDTKNESVHVINLVEGHEIIVESPTNAFQPYIVHYAETFIISAAIGPYTIRPYGKSEGKECATMKAFIRVNA